MATKEAVKKILVVDDEEDILWSLKEFLVNKDLSAEVLTASSGEAALEVLARKRIDLVITDIRMPGMSGLDLLVEIKNRFPYTSVIVMTAFPSSEFKREALLRGGMYFVEKPFDIKVLRERVKDALRDSSQFQGMLTGISLSDVIQIKCMSGVTAALRVTEGKRQGVVFFQKGEIIHAICDDIDGEKAFYEIISFAHGHLDTVHIAEMPARTIFKPYAALLMEGARRMDESGVSGIGQSGTAGEDARAEGDGALANIEFAKVDEAGKPAPQPLPTAELLAGFKSITGYRASAILRDSGEIIVQDAISASIDLRLVGETLSDFFIKAREASGKIGLEFCREALLGTRSEIMIMGCSDEVRGESKLVLAIFGADGNQALGRREMRKVLGRLAGAAN